MGWCIKRVAITTSPDHEQSRLQYFVRVQAEFKRVQRQMARCNPAPVKTASKGYVTATQQVAKIADMLPTSARIPPIDGPDILWCPSTG